MNLSIQGETVRIAEKHNNDNDNNDDKRFKDVETKLAAKMLRKYTSIKDAFLAFDTDHSGRISDNEFRAVLQIWGFRLSQRLFQKLLSRFRSSDDVNGIDYTQFSEYFGKILYPKDSGYNFTPRNNIKNSKESAVERKEETADDVEAALRNALFQQFKSIRSAFLYFDKDMNGTISKEEFKEVLKRYGMRLEDAELQTLFERYKKRKRKKQTSISEPWNKMIWASLASLADTRVEKSGHFAKRRK